MEQVLATAVAEQLGKGVAGAVLPNPHFLRRTADLVAGADCGGNYAARRGR